MSQTPQRIIATGNVAPFRLITPSTTAEHAGAQAGANEPIIGASGQGTKFAPIPEVTTQWHAQAGDPIDLRGPGEEALVEAGAAIDPGTLFKADTNGKAVPVATTGTTNQQYGGRTEQGAADEGELIRVIIEPGIFRPALT